MQTTLKQAPSPSPAISLDTLGVLKWHLRRWNTRLRTSQTLLWLPRGLFFGVSIGLVLALISRLRAWLLPEEILRGSLIAIISAAISTLLIIWLWPRPVRQSAQYFDLRFGLKERFSTALELSEGRLFAPEIIAERQLEDTRIAANRVNLENTLPLKANWLELAILTIGVIVLAILLISDNPFTSDILSERALNQTLSQQQQQVQDLQSQVQNNPELSDEQKEELLETLNELENTLERDEISEAEAVAAIAEAERELREMGSDGMTSDERSAYQEAGRQFARSPQSQSLAEQLQEPNLSEAADALNDLAEQVPNMSSAEQQALADSLDAAANALQSTNPQLADKLREAADALRDGDTERAQQALRDAAEMMEQEAQQNQQQADNAQQLSEQLEQQRRDLTDYNNQNQSGNQASRPQENQNGQQSQQANSPQNQGNNQQPQSGQESSQQQGATGQQPQSGAESEAQQNGQEGSQGQQSQSTDGSESQDGQQEGQNQDGQQGQGEQQDQASQSGQNNPEGQQGQQGQGQQGAQSGNDGSGSEGQSQSGQSGGNQQSEGGQQSSGGDASSQAGGSGAGDTGSAQGNDSQAGSQNNQPGNVSNQPGDDSMRDYTPIYAPQNIGGNAERDPDAELSGQANNDEGDPIREVRPNENFDAESVRPYNQVFQQYYTEAQNALESDYIPLNLRDFIRAYFTSLAPQ